VKDFAMGHIAWGGSSVFFKFRLPPFKCLYQGSCI
jgi:hypothetical protein